LCFIKTAEDLQSAQATLMPAMMWGRIRAGMVRFASTLAELVLFTCW